ncbi:hypothetical protein [Mucilaginibacter defluvii]
MQVLIEKHTRIKSLVSVINDLTTNISNSQLLFFKDITVTMSDGSEELFFRTLINWLYALLYEASARNITFIKNKFNLYGISESTDILIAIQVIRTVLNHNLDLTEASNIKKKNFYDAWFNSKIEKSFPTNNDDWNTCSNYILDQIISLLESLLTCLKAVKNDENFDDIILPAWINIILRNYGVFEFEQVLIKVLENHGLSNIFDTNKIAKAQISNWRNELNVLADGFNFKQEATRIIENYIHKKDLCPVNGDDLIMLGAKKGPNLSKLHNKVKEVFYNDPCQKEQLLQRIIDMQLLA